MAGEDDRSTNMTRAASPTTQRITRISVVPAGLMLAAIGGMLGLCYAPFVVMETFGRRGSAIDGIVMTAVVPFLYFSLGFVAGIVLAVLFNVAAVWTGGLEYDTSTETGEIAQ